MRNESNNSLPPSENLLQDDQSYTGQSSKQKKNSNIIVKKHISGYENFPRLIQLSFTFFVLFCAFFTC